MVIDEVTEKAGREQEKPSNSRRIIEFPMNDGMIIGCEYIPGKGLFLRRKHIDMSRSGKAAYPSEQHYG